MFVKRLHEVWGPTQQGTNVLDDTALHGARKRSLLCTFAWCILPITWEFWGAWGDCTASGSTASSGRGAVVAAAGTLLGHVPPGDLVHTSINTCEQPLCQSFFYIWGILKEARAEESNKRNRTAHEKSLALIWNIPQTSRDNWGEVELEGYSWRLEFCRWGYNLVKFWFIFLLWPHWYVHTGVYALWIHAYWIRAGRKQTKMVAAVVYGTSIMNIFIWFHIIFSIFQMFCGDIYYFYYYKQKKDFWWKSRWYYPIINLICFR